MNKSKSYHGSSAAHLATIPSSMSSEWTSNTNQSLTSPLQSSFAQVSQPNTVHMKKRSSPSLSSAVEFLSLKWLFKRKSYASNKKQQLNANTSSNSEKLTQEQLQQQQQQRPGTATRLKSLANASLQMKEQMKSSKSLSPLKPSYSFDDVEKFLKMSCVAKLKAKCDEMYGSNESVSTTTDKAKLLRTSTSTNLVTYKHQMVHCQLCPLCLTTFAKHEMHTIYSCGCKFCKPCFKEYLTVNIKENNDVCFLNCPDAECPLVRNSDSKRRCKNNLISEPEIEMYVDRATFALYKKFKMDWEVENDPRRTWCPTPNCDTICVITKPMLTSLTSSSSLSSTTSSTNNDRDKPALLSFLCPKCDQTFCSHCRRYWHPGFPCQSASEDDNLTLILQRSNNASLKSEIKRCPRCSVWIERDEGCAQMMCRKCKHVFCWFCLQSLEDDFLLRHYDKGPCKNKLGHSRASVIWHRTQVIGIFAGFGVLLLLASPLFLLAAPCILCCNCCCTSSCKYIEEVDAEPGVADLSLSSSSSFDDEFLFNSKRSHNDKRV